MPQLFLFFVYRDNNTTLPKLVLAEKNNFNSAIFKTGCIGKICIDRLFNKNILKTLYIFQQMETDWDFVDPIISCGVGLVPREQASARRCEVP